ncbi:hypothetical protein FNB79_09150 [Formosa sediminum]|uniref:YdhG-like domain-containing protein n=1 Tax=Formosa sediminum TaxID=2594004 RepID=A0A516GRJ1_9FLAO|nr:YdeI/OmpD-associated family protein [Formosa sediminum]QDO94138.1 hypothetical protein FNB79_09150 [Formosa sediminum]
MKTLDTVTAYIERHETYTEALTCLRNIILSTTLEEAYKWNAPVYTFNGKNVLGLGAFKHHFCIWFFNGVFLKDELKVLTQTSDTTKALRQMRFKSVNDIDKQVILTYVLEAIDLQKSGKAPPPQPKTLIVIPELLKQALALDTELNAQFKLLTPYKQREYFEYIISAKREATKQKRLEKISPMIKQSIGLNGKYKNC